MVLFVDGSAEVAAPYSTRVAVNESPIRRKGVGAGSGENRVRLGQQVGRRRVHCGRNTFVERDQNRAYRSPDNCAPLRLSR